jgi:hypothetical protein
VFFVENVAWYGGVFFLRVRRHNTVARMRKASILGDQFSSLREFRILWKTGFRAVCFYTPIELESDSR